jgi:hypothetical protein
MFYVTPYCFVYDVQRKTTIAANLASYLIGGNISESAFRDIVLCPFTRSSAA